MHCTFNVIHCLNTDLISLGSIIQISCDTVNIRILRHLPKMDTSEEPRARFPNCNKRLSELRVG